MHPDLRRDQRPHHGGREVRRRRHPPVERTRQLDTPVFDASRPLTLNLRAPEGMKTINLRFPTDDEWIERQRRRKAIVKDLGRGMTETTVVNGEEVDAG